MLFCLIITTSSPAIGCNWSRNFAKSANDCLTLFYSTFFFPADYSSLKCVLLDPGGCGAVILGPFQMDRYD